MIIPGVPHKSLLEWANFAPHGSIPQKLTYGRRSTILTSQIPVDKWHAFIGDLAYADAILDRLMHNALR
jgi:hypothetical protein